MKLKTLLLAGLTALAAGLSSSAFARTPGHSGGNSYLSGQAAGGVDLGGDVIAIGFFVAVIAIGAWFGRCHGKRKED